MTNHLKFQVGNIGHGCYFVVSAWLSNFCHSFRNPFITFNPKNWVSTKTGKGFEIVAGWKCRL